MTLYSCSRHMLATLALCTFLMSACASANDTQTLIDQANAGNASAQLALAWRYHQGDRVTTDLQLARTWYSKAAEQGLAEAQNNLGMLFYRGEGGDVDFKKAATWFTAAAESGHHLAQYNLGLMHLSGRAVNLDHAAAARWFHAASIGRVAEAQAELASLLLSGSGIQKNRIEGVAWLIVSSDLGNDDAHSRKIVLENELEPEEVVQAERRARDLVLSLKTDA